MSTKTADVPETDAELERQLDASIKRTRPAKRAAKPAAQPPTGQAPAAPKPDAPASVDVTAIKQRLAELNLPFDVPEVGQAAWAPFRERADIVAIMWQLRRDGWERPAISALTGFNDSTVYRAQRGRTHTGEVDAWLEFFSQVANGTHKPPAGRRKQSVEDVRARVGEALDVLGNEAKTATQYRKLIEAAQEILRDVAPQAGDDTEAEATEAA